ncbi:Polyadenylate-binding protein 5 [Raphanus sativus]|uniref:Polyadenylate-binding protein n=1 Tax=Raphanus sativus TaxID=3726 RepID=A0A6J0M910_RAPSA|nr:polyadenylate-binding protein 5 [Raphanus sativus]KAJ4909495.1 Polyadenylate-binding protein 5 [Raphanus sativus]
MAAAFAFGSAPTAEMVDQVPKQQTVPAETQVAAAATVAEALQTHPNSSLYVGDLDRSVNEAHLLDVFNQVAPVQTVRVCRDLTHRSLGYAYVNFANPNDAMRAMDILNYTPIKDRPIRIMRSNRDPSTRLSGKGNVFIKNLDVSIDNKDLYDTFSTFGTILSCKVELDVSGRSKGYGFVQFEKVETAQDAIDKLNGMLLNDKQVFVGPFVRRQDRTRSESVTVPRFTNVYVKNLPKETDDDELKKTFGKYGDISSAVVMKDESGNSKCFGFVNFVRSEDAVVAVEKMNGISLGENVLFVGKAQKKSERQEELKRKYEQEKISRLEKLQGTNLYVKNLDDSVDDEKLKEMFSEYGNVTSSKVMMNSGGLSRGFGFVAYSTPEEASKAMNEMNGKMIGAKPLYIALAQRKEERRTHLQTKFSHMRPNGTMTPMTMPGFHHHPPGGAMAGPPHQQVYLGQNGQGLMPSQPMGYGYQLQFMPRPRYGPANFVMPYPPHRHNQHGPRVGFRRGATNMHQQHFQQQQPWEMMQQNASSGMRFLGGAGNRRNGMESSAAPQGIVSLPLDSSAISHNASQKPPLLPISKLSSALALASPANHPQMLGEQLFPLVEKEEPVHTAKVTGMLLQMDQAEILHLLESPEALKAKVSEALDALRLSANPPAVSSVDDQFAPSSTE